jgi:hypothetical protein
MAACAAELFGAGFFGRIKYAKSTTKIPANNKGIATLALIGNHLWFGTFQKPSQGLNPDLAPTNNVGFLIIQLLMFYHQ